MDGGVGIVHCAAHDDSSPGVPNMILLETPRLRLRRFTPADVDLLVELDADPEVMRYITGGRPTPREMYVQTFMPRWFEIYARFPQLGYWAAERRPDHEFLGWFHLRDDRIEPEYLELGYRLKRAAWGQGFATEGSRGLIDHGFQRAGAEQISARTLLGNRASQHVMEKCGLRRVSEFVYPETLKIGDTEDERRACKYEITRAQWLANRA
jgi:RimJ/RimL family protein N-acetyltransferase